MPVMSRLSSIEMLVYLGCTGIQNYANVNCQMNVGIP